MALRPAARHYQDRGSTLITAPAVEPVTLAEMRTHLRLHGDDTSENDLLTDLIQEARQEIEQRISRAMIEQTWQLTIDHWPHGREPWWEGTKEAHIHVLHGNYGWLVLPKSPLISVESVTVYDEDSTAQSINVAQTFDIDTAQEPGRLALKSGQTWPVALRPTNAIEVVYKARFTTSADDVQGPLKRAVRNLAAYAYQYRGDCSSEAAMLGAGVKGVVDQYKVLKI